MAIQAQMYPDNFGLPLGGSQDWLMMDPITNNSTANNFLNSCGSNEFSFNLHQKLQQQQFQYQQQHQQLTVQLQNLQQRNQSLSSDNGYMFLPSTPKNFNHPTTSGNHMSMNFSQSLASQIDKQRQEIDRYISLENERLKLALQEQRKQQLGVMLKKVEEKATILLRQKDEEIAKARKRTMELEELRRKMEVEGQAWQRVAAENEAMVFSLSTKLEELKEQACCLTSSNGLEDAESCCDGNGYNPCNRGNQEEEEEETGESSRQGGERNKMMMMMVCRVCNSRNACILFLPCRHLCSCKACETFLDFCPLCNSAKKASIEALVS